MDLSLIHAVAVDLSTPDGPQKLVARTGELGGPDILVNNVGAVALRLGGFSSVTDDEWWASLNLNFMAAVRTTRAALPAMLKRGGGSIVTISSVNSFLPDPTKTTPLRRPRPPIFQRRCPRKWARREYG